MPYLIIRKQPQGYTSVIFQNLQSIITLLGIKYSFHTLEEVQNVFIKNKVTRIEINNVQASNENMCIWGSTELLRGSTII